LVACRQFSANLMPSPVKVLFLVNTLRVGGAERNVAALCERIDRNRFSPEVWVLQGGGQYEEQVLRTGTRLRNLDRGFARNPLFAWRTAREISRADADLIHAFLPSMGAYAALARNWFGVRQPMILSIGQGQTIRRERWMFRYCSRTFDWLVANSRTAEDLGRTLGFDPQRISLVPNGHQVDRYCRDIDRGAVRASVGVGPNEQMLLCVGRLIDTKRVCDAVAALGLLGSDTSAKLVIAGDGPERGALAEEVSSRELSKRVVFAGQRKDVADLLQAADMFVFPSETEGLPNALIEACLAGLPVVACRVGGVVDLVENGKTAVLVPPRSPADLAAAIRELLSDRVAATRMAAAAQAHVRTSYSIEQTLCGLYDVYERLLVSSRCPTTGRAPSVNCV
jgi:glycosyltransferase involved in cell wall biosynthesis